jgi:DNA-directed RNA polymerase, mitochondrial
MSVTPSGEALLIRQRELEDHMLGEGAKRFRRKVEAAMSTGETSSAGAGIKLLRSAVNPVAAGIAAMIDEKGKRGPKHLAHRWCVAAGPETAAFITSRVIIDAVMATTPLATVAMQIATLLLDELRFRRFQEKRPALFDYKIERLPGTNYRHNKKVLDQSIRWAVENPRDDDEPLDLSDLSMSDYHKMLVGTKLIDVFIHTTGLVELVSRKTQRKGKKRDRLKGELYLQPTPETREWITKRNAAMEFLTPITLPMVVPPLPWAPSQRGGYRYALRNRYPFVRGASSEMNLLHAETDMPLVYEAVNAIQETAWTVNQHVLSLVEEIRVRGKALAGLPAYDREPLPPKPKDIGTNEEARKKWRKAARIVHENNHAREIKALEVEKTLLAVRAVREEPTIYFPCSVDFRGRVYPMTTYLNPQGDDLSKALLTFAEKKPLGPDGAFWLAIHGANSLDETPDGLKVKTMTMQERASWIQRNSHRIIQAARDPFADLWWADADEPLQFFAFAVEWANWIDAYREGKGDEYECGLPVSQDGSCNGLQHFSAMLRDSVGGAATNLVASERPQDVYQAVADNVCSLVNDDLRDEDRSDQIEGWFAKQWLATGLVKRKLVKRPTMTFGYGSKLFGMRSQTEEFLQAYPDSKRSFIDEKGVNFTSEAALYIARHIWSSLQETVVAAAQGMKWMQDSARTVALQMNKAVEWTVPATGFRVRQEYYVSNRKQIKTVLAGQVVQPSVYERTQVVLQHKQANAVAPNFVHSLDAACLMLTVVQAKREGLTSFGMIHDSYATTPADCGTLARCTRETFVRFYSEHDVIGSLYSDFCDQLAENAEKPIHAPPSPGSLQIEGVLQSTYFFS